MKKIIFISLAFLFSFGDSALPSVPTDRIMDKFHQDFPAVHQQIIRDCGDYYVIFFKDMEASSCRVFYTSAGAMLGTIKYYDAAKLDAFIRCKVAQKYHGKEIKGITELTSTDYHYYEIILQDNKGGCRIRYDGNGTMTMLQKWHTI